MRAENSMRRLFEKTADCISPEDIERYNAGTCGEPLKNSIANHLLECPACKVELDLIRSFLEATPTETEREDVEWVIDQVERRVPQLNPNKERRVPSNSFFERLRGIIFPFRLVPALATLAAAVLFAFLIVPYFDSAPPEITGPSGSTGVLRSDAVQLEGPTGLLDSLPERVEWKAYAGARSYRVIFQAVDQSEIASSEVEATLVEIPQVVKEYLEARRTVIWQVFALDESGAVLRTSIRAEIQLER